MPRINPFFTWSLILISIILVLVMFHQSGVRLRERELIEESVKFAEESARENTTNFSDRERVIRFPDRQPGGNFLVRIVAMETNGSPMPGQTGLEWTNARDCRDIRGNFVYRALMRPEGASAVYDRADRNGKNIRVFCTSRWSVFRKAWIIAEIFRTETAE
jgi:hypothetical protein